MINQKKSGKFLRSEQVKRTGIFGTLAWTGLVALAGLCFFAARWYIRTYGDLGFDSIMYTVFSDLGGVQSGLLISFGLKAAVPAVLLAAAAFLMLRQLRKTRAQRVLVRLTALCMSLLMILQAAFSTGLPEYVYGLFHETPVFDQYYVQPTAENVKFPEEKRNLIYIFLESMEISYLSEELGGGQEDNLIPELYELATEHTNFSHDDTEVGGFLPVTGATWTIGAMVAHTAGVPLKLPPDVAENDYGQGDDGFLPGITSLQNILHDQGYYQTLMVGDRKSHV